MVEARIRSFRLQEADAFDAQQSTWLRLLQHAGRLHTPEHLGGWLATVATRECLAILRARRDGAVVDDASVLDAPDPAPGPADQVITAETNGVVHAAVGRLTPRRQVLVRSLFSEKSLAYADLARETGMPVGSIGPTRARALVDLRHELEGLLTA